MTVFSTTTDVTDSTSATLTDTGLRFPVAANHMYHFRAVLPFTTAATTTGLAVAVDVPNSPTFFAVTADSANAAATGSASSSGKDTGATATDAAQITFTGAPATAGAIAVIEGYVKPSVAGEVNIQFNTEVNGSAVTVKAGAQVTFEDRGIV